MIQSMTGFGKCQSALGLRTLLVDIRTLNSKQLDVNLRLPQVLREKEAEIRQLLSKSLERGKIDVFMTFKSEGGDTMLVNEALIASRVEQLSRIGTVLGQDVSSVFGMVMSMPDVFQEPDEPLSEAEWITVLDAVQKALGETRSFRLREGKGLEDELRMRLTAIEKALSEVALLEPERNTLLRDRIRQRMADWNVNADENRFEEEMIYYLEKLDISEEKQRLSTHCRYFAEVLGESESQGRKLGFISQEMGREINTIGSKANHAGIQRLVVLMKDELEKIKEQLNNVL